MKLLATLLSRRDRPDHRCRHVDGCATVVGPDQLLCTEHQILERLDWAVANRLWPCINRQGRRP